MRHSPSLVFHVFIHHNYSSAGNCSLNIIYMHILHHKPSLSFSHSGRKIRETIKCSAENNPSPIAKVSCAIPANKEPLSSCNYFFRHFMDPFSYHPKTIKAVEKVQTMKTTIHGHTLNVIQNNKPLWRML